jgi:serine/threonine protein kinase
VARLAEQPHSDRKSDRTASSRRWAQLGYDAGSAQVMRKLVPDHPPVSIGRFEILGQIGEGGYGVVFKARDPDLHRLVAIKLCLASSERAAQALMAEAKLVAQLNHSNIVTVYELGRHDGDVFIAMEYVDGSNVSEFARHNPSSDAIIDVYRGVVRGLAAAHEAGIVHGDVKPSNILLARNGIPRVADFGLAKLHEPASVAEHGKFVPSGTPAYMAPEVLCGQLPNALSDQWSSCVSLWETLTGEPLFDGRSRRRLLRQIKRVGAKLDHERIPTAMREILRVGLSLDPRERYSSMNALGDALDWLRAPAPAPVPNDVVELTPVIGEAAASKAKRGAFVVPLLIGLVCMTLGWVIGRGRVEAEVLRVSEPIPRPAPSPCAVDESAATVSTESVLIVTCSCIRAGKLLEATRLWDAEFIRRRDPPVGVPEPTIEDLALLRAETLTVARTFGDQAERFQRWTWVTRSVQWTAKVLRRPIPDDPAVVSSDYAENWMLQIEGLDP